MLRERLQHTTCRLQGECSSHWAEKLKSECWEGVKFIHLEIHCPNPTTKPGMQISRSRNWCTHSVPTRLRQPWPQDPSLNKPQPGQGNPEIQPKIPTPLPIKHQHPSTAPGISKLPADYSTFKCGKSCKLHGYRYVKCQTFICVQIFALYISFLKIYIDVNFKNLFGMNFFLKFSYAGQMITKWYSSSTHPKSQLLPGLSSLCMPFCLPSSIIILNFVNSLPGKYYLYFLDRFQVRVMI